MVVDIIVGATWGEEGKSKFARYYSDEIVDYDGVIKIGGYCTNNFLDWRMKRMIHGHQLPAAIGHKDELFYIFPQGSFIDLKELAEEVEIREIPRNRIVIDPNAFIVDPESQELKYAKFVLEQINQYVVVDVSKLLTHFQTDARFLVEGCGGYGLAKTISVMNPDFFLNPFRMPNMTASGIAYMLNIAPTEVDDVILVSRIEDFAKVMVERPSFKELLLSENPGQTSFKKINSPGTTPFNTELVREAICVNDPSIFVLNHLDLVEDGREDNPEFTDRQYDVIDWVETELNISIDYVGYGAKSIGVLTEPGVEPYEMNDLFSQIANDPKVGRILPRSRIVKGEIPN